MGTRSGRSPGSWSSYQAARQTRWHALDTPAATSTKGKLTPCSAPTGTPSVRRSRTNSTACWSAVSVRPTRAAAVSSFHSRTAWRCRAAACGPSANTTGDAPWRPPTEGCRALVAHGAYARGAVEPEHAAHQGHDADRGGGVGNELGDAHPAGIDGDGQRSFTGVTAGHPYDATGHHVADERHRRGHPPDLFGDQGQVHQRRPVVAHERLADPVERRPQLAVEADRLGGPHHRRWTLLGEELTNGVAQRLLRVVEGVVLVADGSPRHRRGGRRSPSCCAPIVTRPPRAWRRSRP